MVSLAGPTGSLGQRALPLPHRSGSSGERVLSHAVRQAQGHLPAADFEMHGAVDRTPHVVAGNRAWAALQEPLHCREIAVANPERVGAVDHARAAGNEEAEPGELAAHTEHGIKEQGQPGVGKHGRLRGGFVRRQARLGQHEMQDAAGPDERIVNDHSDARAERIGAQGGVGIVRYRHITHADHDLVGKNGGDGRRSGHRSTGCVPSGKRTGRKMLRKCHANRPSVGRHS